MERDIFHETATYGGNGQTTTAPVASLPGVGPAQQGGTPGAQTFPTVLGGTDGWLYYGGDIRNACRPVLSAPVTVERLNRLADIIKRAGKTFVLFIPPDKTDVYPEHLPATYLGSDCAPKAQRALWAALAAHPPAGYQDLHGALLRAKAQAPAVPLYRKLDTHWNGRGALMYGQMLADSLDPRLWPTTHVTELGDQPAHTDLAALLGETTPEQAPAFAVTRPGVVNTRDDAGQVTNTTTNAPLIKKRTLFISDSFTESSRFALNPFFESAGFTNSIAAQTEFGNLAASIRGAGVVVLEIVERDVVDGEAPILRTDVLDRLAVSLGEH
jgi:hypothetical protein